MCQEPHPELYGEEEVPMTDSISDFISEARLYEKDGEMKIIFKRESKYPGSCIMHKPKLGDTLPVYVRDKYEEFSNGKGFQDVSSGF